MDFEADESFKVNNHTDMDVNALSGEITRFYPYAKKKLGFDKPVIVNLLSDLENSKNIFGKTAQYNPSNMTIDIFVDGRHPKDILRSLSHELVHHTQNCRGDFDKLGPTEEGYAQKNPFLRKLEAEAYLLGNGLLFRDFEDMRKSKMKTNENKFNLKDMIRKVLKETLNAMEEDAYSDETIDEQEVEYINFPPQKIKSLRGTPKPRLTRKQMRLAKQGDAEAKAAVQARRDWVKANRKGASSSRGSEVVDAGLGQRTRDYSVRAVPRPAKGGEYNRIADMAADRKKSNRMSNMLKNLTANQGTQTANKQPAFKGKGAKQANKNLEMVKNAFKAAEPGLPEKQYPEKQLRIAPAKDDRQPIGRGLEEVNNIADNRSNNEWYNDTLFENLVKKWTK